MTRRDAGPNLHDDDEGIDELGDDAIIAQQSDPHTAKPRTRVKSEAASVIISDRSAGRRRRGRGSSEKTLVIRDRKTVEAVRRRLKQDESRYVRNKKLKSAAVWGIACLVAFGLGGLLSVLLSRGGENAAGGEAQPGGSPSILAPEHGSSLPAAETTPSALQPALSGEGQSVRLDDLPVESSKSRERTKQRLRPGTRPR
ncbi:MAG TPA: hypothetical protein VGJ84_21435 [Polyangiaceae bacterium]